MELYFKKNKISAFSITVSCTESRFIFVFNKDNLLCSVRKHIRTNSAKLMAGFIDYAL
jgi:hypothetical protein